MRASRKTRALCTLLVLFAGRTLSQERITLPQAVELALRQNPSLAASRQVIELASGRFWKEVSPPPPTLSWTREYIPSGRSIAQFQEQTVALNQSIDFPASWFLKGKALSASRRQAEALVQSSTLGLITDVKSAYYAARGCADKLELAKENVTIARDFALRAEIRYKEGDATHLEYQTASVQLGQALQALEKASKEDQVARAQLLFLLGRSTQQAGAFSLSLDSLRYDPVPESLEGYMLRAGQSNPRLCFQKSKVEEAAASASLAWWNIMPSFSLSYLWQSRDGISGYYGFGVGISLPVWALFDNRGRIEEASATMRASEYELRNTEQSVEVEVRRAWLELKECEHRIELYVRDILKQSDEVHRTALVSYASGEITYLEYLQARQLAIQSRLEYIDALVQVNASRARLEEAVGLIPTIEE